MTTMAVALDRNLFFAYYSSIRCCCCSKVLRRHTCMAHRPSTSFMSVIYNLAKWLFLYSVYFFFFLLCSSFFPSVHTQLFTIELFTMVLITCELIYIPIC